MGCLDCLYGQWWREYLLDRGWTNRDAHLFEHYWMLIWEQIAAVIPISILLVAVMGIFFGQTVDSPIEVMFGMICAIFGLAFFVDSLRVVVMPLSEQLGTELPKNLTLPWVLVTTCFLGILVTYAEPAITSLRPLARLVDPDVAPYLYCALMEKQEILVFCIGMGVGLAAMLGTLRFVRGWSLKPMIVGVMFPTLTCAAYMWWGDEELRPLLGLAWDCGAVTTGPVTVPVLLALGIGVMKTQREKKEAAEKLRGKEQVANAAADALEGFGIVTLASLFPVLAVELLSIALKLIYTHEDIIAMEPADPDPDSLLEQTPYREVYFAVRAILPLNVALVFLVIVVLRKPLPAFTYYLPPEQMSAPPSRDNSTHGRNSMNRLSREQSGDRSRMSSFRASVEYVRSLMFSSRMTQRGGLQIFSSALNSVSAYALARSEGISASFRHASNARPSMDSFRFGKRGAASIEMDNIQNKQSRAEKSAADELALKDIESAFSGELQHEKSGEATWSASIDKTADKSNDDNGEAGEGAAGVGLGAKRGSKEVQRDGGSSPVRKKGATFVENPQKVESASTTSTSIMKTRPSKELTKENSISSVKFSNSAKFSSNVDAMLSEERDSVDLIGRPSQGSFKQAESGGELQPSIKEEPAVPVAGAGNMLILVAGVIQAQLGMIMFNLGLNWGFTSIGDQVGTLLPAAFLATPAEPENSPYYSYGNGVAIALGTMFCLGVLATRAEPALNVVGATVEKLTKGGFTKNMLIYSVCFGVGMGMVVGATKILFGAGLIWFIILKYAVALTLTAFTHEDFINIAWDSAGVTTGPVTVPFVLSTGVGCSKAVQASEGFGILACASVWPIITVLSMDGCRRLYKKFKQGQG